jgi:serine/threonine protein kinase/tetratricopeptide (TPR) repeat protein
MNPKDETPEHLPTVSGPNLGPANLSTPPEVEGYEILRVLGEGGMGVVYLARQNQPIERQVALKVIKAGMDSKQVITRFEAERQALAMLDHPNIAHVYDAGSTKDEHPYFSMEYVSGLSITEHCDQHKLSIEERLLLFTEVCDGVQHAHQKGIIHRDIKPSNILVSAGDDKPLPRIIDFGVAKAVTAALTEQTLFTEQGQLLGTPEYMSPEQAEMTRQDVDTRSDIYSLGVVLYELLTGALPFERETLEQAGFAEILRTIREEDPPVPSARLSSLESKTSHTAENRKTSPNLLPRQVRGDLDWIAMKSLDKDRARRYATASDLSADILRHLNSEPVDAGPPTISYKLHKFIRRHRVAVAAVVTVLVVLVAGVIISTVFAVGQARARTEAERQTAIAEAVVEFLNGDLLASVVPARAKGKEVTVREILDTASQRIEGRFKHERLVEASIRHTLGHTYEQLGEYVEAARHLESAYQLCQKDLGPDDPLTLQSLCSLGWCYIKQGCFQEANSLLLKGFEDSNRLLGAEHSTSLAYMKCLGALHAEQGHYDRAETIYLAALDMERGGVLGEENHSTLNMTHMLGLVYIGQGRLKDAKELLVHAVTRKKRVIGEEHPDTLRSMGALARVYTKQGSYQDALSLYTELLEISRRVMGEDHPDTVRHIGGTAWVYYKLKRYAEAETLYRGALKTGGRVFGKEHPSTLHYMHDLALLYSDEGHYREAESMYQMVSKIRKRILGEEHSDTLLSANNLANLYRRQDKFEQAESLLLEVYNLRQPTLGAKHPKTLGTIRDLIKLYRAWDKPQDAEGWWARLMEDMRAHKIERVVPQENLQIPDKMHTCAANLKRIHAAIGKYQKDKGKLPNWLSDLVPGGELKVCGPFFRGELKVCGAN